MTLYLPAASMKLTTVVAISFEALMPSILFTHYLPEVSLPRAQPQQVPHGARVPAGGQHQAVKPQLGVRAVTVLHPHLGSR